MPQGSQPSRIPLKSRTYAPGGPRFDTRRYVTRVTNGAEGVAGQTDASQYPDGFKCSPRVATRRTMKALGASRLLTSIFAAFAWVGIATAQAETQATYIVQGATLEAALTQVRRVGAEPDRELSIIHAVAVRLTEAQLARLRANSSVRVFDDRAITTRGTLLGGLQDLVNDVNSTLAETQLVQAVQTVAAPVVSTVACNSLLSSVTSPLVGTLTNVQNSTSLASLPLVYETNYPAMIGADTLHCRGITGKRRHDRRARHGYLARHVPVLRHSHPRHGRRDERRHAAP